MSERQPSVEEIRIAIRRATLAHRMTPVLFGSAAKNCAIQELLDGIAFYLPAPTDRVVWDMTCDPSMLMPKMTDE